MWLRLGFVCVALGVAVTAQAAPFAYVPGSNSTSMTVIDTATDTVVDTINVGDTFMQSAAVSPDGTRVYAGSINSGKIWVINTLTNAVVTGVPASYFGVYALAVDPSGARLYATTGDNQLAVMDTATNTMLAPITGSFDAPQNVAVTPDGTRAYVSNAFGGYITVVDLVANSVLTTIPTFTSTRGVDILPDGSRAYVTEDSFGLDVIDTATNTLVTTVPILSAVGAAVHPDGSKVYVSTGSGVTVVDTATNAVITSVPVGGINFGVSVNPDGSKVYVASYSADAVFVIDTATNMSLGSVPVASQPFARGDFIGPAFVCGDGTQNPGEQCDDGNTDNGDCCSSTCQYPTGCKAAGKSLLLLKNDATDDTKDKLIWKWLKGADTSLQDLGLPTGTTSYTLCLYAGTASASVAFPAGSNWQTAGSKGYKFKDPSGTPKALLMSGAAGKAKTLVKGKGTNLPDTLVPALSLPVRARLVNDTNSTCFEATYSTASKNDATQFKAKTP